MKKKLIGSMIALLMIGIVIYFFAQKSPSQDNSTFIVGTAAGYAPFVSVNASGEYEGFDIDVAHALANKLNKKLVIKDLGSMTSLFMALDQGMIDAIIWGISITQDRLAKVAMIHYYGSTVTSYPLIFWKTIPTDIQSLTDMNNKIVCIEPGSSQDVVLLQYPQIRTLQVDKIDDALLQIQYGKADAAFVEPAIAIKFKNKYPEIQAVDIPLALSNQVQGMGVVIKKNKEQLVHDVEQAIAVLKSAGTIEQFAQKWEIPS
ncbi:MAG: transporter substrate-binding domain-containing protein [Candidatus Dependentiae bacterium]|nr:transporter substrate-binding domain-containing protein [Candidatus Dependentiae bacterium]